MRWIQRIGLLVLALLVLGAGALGVYVFRSHPALDGELAAPGLAQPVKVSRDAADVTHIEAASERDAWFALGYVHAQERGWQLEFNRRVMHGRLSEILGEATLETDKLLRTLGIMQAAQRQLAALPAEAQQAVQAYADGINAFYAASPQALPPEFHVLGTRPGGGGPAWTAADSVGWSLMMALDLGGNWGNEFARLSALQVLDTPALWQLMPPYPGERPVARADLARQYAEWGVYRKTTTQSQAPQRPPEAGGTLLAGALRTDLARWAQDFANHLGTVDGKGSNNWVIAGSRSASGKPIVANDPHLSLSAPAIWYFARMSAPGLDVMGASFPGLPFVVLGRTRQVAWGFTNTAPDVQDLYLERIHPDQPGQYQTPEGWAAFETREEIIRVKGKPDVRHTVRSTRHGPVLSDAQASHQQLLDTQRYVLALRWTALDTDNRTLLAGIRSNRARSVDELLAAYEDFHAPMQSVVMADTSGRTAFKTAGRVPLRRADNDIMGVAPSPGWDARYDWTGWLPYAQTPQADSAAIEAAGWLATANQRIHSPDFAHFLTQDWELPYRKDRIDVLLARGPQTLDAQAAVHGDVVSASAKGLLPYLVQAPVTHALGAAAQQLLAGFDAELRADSAAALVFAVWTDEFTRGVIGGRLGEAKLMGLYGKRVFRAAIEGILARNDTAWCGAAGCAAASGQALDRALTRIEAMQGRDVNKWQWGTAHPAISAHRPFSNVGALARFFDVRVPTGGDRFTVNMGHFHADHEKEPFANRHGPSMRTLYDLSNLENSRFIYQTGQSGLVFSSRYRDMSEEWAAVRYRPLQMDPPGFSHRLTLTP